MSRSSIVCGTGGTYRGLFASGAPGRGAGVGAASDWRSRPTTRSYVACTPAVSSTLRYVPMHSVTGPRACDGSSASRLNSAASSTPASERRCARCRRAASWSSEKSRRSAAAGALDAASVSLRCTSSSRPLSTLGRSAGCVRSTLISISSSSGVSAASTSVARSQYLGKQAQTCSRSASSTLASTCRGLFDGPCGCSARVRSSNRACESGTSSCTKCVSAVLVMCSRRIGRSQPRPVPLVLGRPSGPSSCSGSRCSTGPGPHASIAAPITASASGRASKSRCARSEATCTTVSISSTSAARRSPSDGAWRRRAMSAASTWSTSARACVKRRACFPSASRMLRSTAPSGVLSADSRFASGALPARRQVAAIAASGMQ